MAFKFDPDRVRIDLSARQDDTPVRGNALASGDDAVDKATEDEILRRLDDGDEWAWALVTVRATYDGVPDVYAEDHLGACCYADESDFRKDPYYSDMVDAATRELRETLEDIHSVLTGEV